MHPIEHRGMTSSTKTAPSSAVSCLVQLMEALLAVLVGFSAMTLNFARDLVTGLRRRTAAAPTLSHRVLRQHAAAKEAFGKYAAAALKAKA